MNEVNGVAVADNATVSTDESPQAVSRYSVESDDGWTVTAATPEALAELIDRKLEQARQHRADADAAIKTWTAAAKSAAK